MTPEQINKIMVALTELYPSLLKMTNTEIDLWSGVFRNCNFEIMMQCVKAFCLESQFTPKISDLVRLYNDRIKEISDEIKQGTAWLYTYHAKIGSAKDTEEWVAKYIESIRKFPVYQRKEEAKKIIFLFRKHATANDWKNIDFADWIDSGGANEL